MWDLFCSEFKRYRLAAIVILIGQLVLWTLYSRFDPVLIPRSEKHAFLVFSCLFGGIFFAAISIGLHKRKNSWTYLVHRPLATNKIHAAISCAGLAVLFIAFVLPFLIIICYMDLVTNAIVEFRHYIYMLHLFLIATVAYFLGQFAMLTPNRLVFASLWILTYLIISNQEPVSYFAIVDMTFLATAIYLAHRSFKVNLATYSEDKGVIILSAVVLQPALLVALLSLQAFYYHIPLNIIGAHPNQVELAKEESGSYRQFVRNELPEMFQQVLATSSSSIAESLTRQVTLAEFEDFSRASYRVPQRQGMFMHESTRHFMLSDGESASWYFSHKDMLFVGYDNISNDIIGYLGPRGFISVGQTISEQDRFEHVAIGVNQRYIQTKRSIYRVDFVHKRIDLKHTLTGENEVYRTVFKPMFDVTAIQSNKATYFFNQVSFNDTFNSEIPSHVIKHPAAITYKLDTTITQTTDGYVLIYLSHHLLGADKAGATLVYAPHEGDTQILATLAFSQTLPALIHYQRLMISPIVLNILDNTLISAVHFPDELPKQQGYFWLRDIPTIVTVFCIFAALVSAFTIYWLANRCTVSNSNKWLWTTIGLLCGIPGLIAFLLMSPWRERNISEPLPMYKKELANV